MGAARRRRLLRRRDGARAARCIRCRPGGAAAASRCSSSSAPPRSLARFRDVMNAAPAELSLACAFLTAPDEDDVPERPARPRVRRRPRHVRRRRSPTASGAGADPRARPGRRLLRADRLRRPPVLARRPARLPQLLDGRERRRPAGRGDRRASCARAGELPAGPRRSSSSPGAARCPRFGPEHSPLGGREAGFIVHPLLLWEDPADDARMRALGRAIRDDMAPWSVGATYPNFLGDEGRDRTRAAFGDAAPTASPRSRPQWDPHGVFRTPQSTR